MRRSPCKICWQEALLFVSYHMFSHQLLFLLLNQTFLCCYCGWSFLSDLQFLGVWILSGKVQSIQLLAIINIVFQWTVVTRPTYRLTDWMQDRQTYEEKQGRTDGRAREGGGGHVVCGWVSGWEGSWWLACTIQMKTWGQGWRDWQAKYEACGW